MHLSKHQFGSEGGGGSLQGPAAGKTQGLGAWGFGVYNHLCAPSFPLFIQMTITDVQPNDHHHLQSIADLLGAASKIVTVTGAGISTKAGIPVSITTTSCALI